MTFVGFSQILQLSFISNTNTRSVRMSKLNTLLSPRHKNIDHSLHQRDILNTIDMFPQIMKEDKLFLRNKIKDIFKEFQAMETNLPEDCVELLQIFNQCTKPLNKIHLFNNHWHNLQVKLRKYITNQKKKYKEDCLIQFKKQKYQQNNKKSKMMQKRIKHDDGFSRCSRESKKKDTKSSFHEFQLKMNQSQEHKRTLSPNIFQQSKRINNTTRNRCLSGKNSMYQSFRHFLAPQSCKNSTKNFAYENFDWNRAKLNTQKSIQKIQKCIKNHQATFNLTHKQNKPKQRSKFQLGQSYKKLVQQQKNWEKIRQENKYQKQSIQRKQQELNLDNYEPYKHSKQGFTVENFSSIKQQKQCKTYRNNLNPVSSFSDHDNQNLFTSPELLQECRKFIKITQSQSKDSQKSYLNSGIKSGINLFDRIEALNFQSPQFTKPKLQKFETPKEMLKHIFQKNWNIYVSVSEKQQLIETCPQHCEQFIRLLMDQLQKNKNFLNFIQVYPYIKKHLNINFNFSNIFLLLDVDSKGSIVPQDYCSFIQNFQNCPIDTKILTDLQTKLTQFENIVNQTFKNIEITPGCFEYLELIDKKQIYQLAEILQMFQFQIDSRQNTEISQEVL